MTMMIFDELNREWSQTVNARRTQRRLADWKRSEPVLDSLCTLGDVVSLGNGTDREQSDEALRSLLRIGADDALGLRSVLQVVMPGLICTARRFVPGPASDEEVAAAVVAAAWGRIAEYPIDRRPRSIAANIVLDARQSASASLFKHAAVEIPSSDVITVGNCAAYRPDPSLSLARLLERAVRANSVSVDDARLVALTRIQDVPIDVLARERGVLPQSLRRRRLRAEAALASAVR